MSNNINPVYVRSNVISTPAEQAPATSTVSGAVTETALSFADELGQAMQQDTQEEPAQTAAQAGYIPSSSQLYGSAGTTELFSSLLLEGGGVNGILMALLFNQLLGGNSSSGSSLPGNSSLASAVGSSAAAAYSASSLGASGVGESVLSLAFSRLGSPYSQGKAGQDNYVDCSYLTQWCYKQNGVNLPRTAAEQAKYCVDNGLTISKEELQPGDLVFFSNSTNGRYMNVTHVAVYAGNGMIVDASSKRGEVVHREMFSGQVLYGRPGAASA